MEEVPFTRGSDNIFLDMGFEPEEAAELLAKSALISEVRHTIEKRKLTQKQAADICHTDQPTLSKVQRGHLHLVTIDRLASWLTLLGRSVEIRVAPYRVSKKPGRLVAMVDRQRRPPRKTPRKVAQ